MEMSPGFRRALALALLGLVIALVWRVAIAPVWAAFERDREAVSGALETIARYNALADRREQFARSLKRLEQDPRLDDALIDAETDTLAAAELQQRVKATVERHGGSLVSSQVLDTEASGPFSKVRVNVRMTLSVEQLQRVLYELESARPVLVADELLVLSRSVRRTRNQRDGSEQLDVRMQLAGFLTAPAAGETTRRARARGARREG